MTSAIRSDTTSTTIETAGEPAPQRSESWAPITLPLGRFERGPGWDAPTFTFTLTPDRATRRDGAPRAARARARARASGSAEDATLPAAASFILDSVHGHVPVFTIARMIGRFFLAEVATRQVRSVTVGLTGSDLSWAMARVNRLSFEVEKTAFGRAHVLHEDDVFGLYVLEIAPGHAIPPHAHKVMRERELVLDDGLTIRGRPVARGLAFDWPLGHVHAYENPTDRPLRVLCIDSPRFLPEDEVALADPPPPAPLEPLGNYLG